MNITSLPSTHSGLPANHQDDSRPANRLTSTQADSPNGSPLTSSSPSTSNTNSVEPRRSALELVEQTLARAYEKMGLRTDKATQAYVGFEPLTAEKVASNILGFIERRLTLDAAEGATAEQLQSRLEAGLKGFKQGFAEASEQLKALNMLSPAVVEDIGKTYDLVLEGIEKLRASLIPELLEPSKEAPFVSQAGSSSQSLSASYQYAAASSFRFELTTAEGDRVSINASRSESQSFSYAGVSHGAGSATQIQLSQSQATSLDWHVEGDLNDDELNAIGNLLDKINLLASEFFQGNLGAAFDQALALGHDKDQIATFSLNLTQVEVQKVNVAYQQFSELPAAPGLNDQLQPLGRFVRHLLETLEQFRDFAAPKALLLDLAEKMPERTPGAERQPGEVFSDFLRGLLQTLRP